MIARRPARGAPRGLYDTWMVPPQDAMERLRRHEGQPVELVWFPPYPVGSTPDAGWMASNQRVMRGRILSVHMTKGMGPVVDIAREHGNPVRLPVRLIYSSRIITPDEERPR